MQHFVEAVKTTPEKKVLLLMDGHASHTKNLEAINYARRHGVVMFSFPAHTTHRLQPLDVSFFKPLSLYYIDETEKWLRLNPGRTVTVFQVSMLFGKAYFRAASVGTAANGFLKTGIHPFNKDVFADYEFIEAGEQENEHGNQEDYFGTVLQVQDPIDPLSVNALSQDGAIETIIEEPMSNAAPPLPSASMLARQADDPSPTDAEASNINDESPPATSIQVRRNGNVRTPSKGVRSESTSFEFHIQQISPVAKKIAQELRKRSRKAQSSMELTSSPYKTALDENAKFLKQKKPKLSTKEPQPSTSKQVNENIEKWFCKICLKCEIEDMIQCMICKAWVHVDCACVKKHVKKYLCPQCTT